MLSSDIILGTKNKDFFTEGCDIVCAVLTQNYDYWPCGTPVMVAVKQKASTCVSVFPPRANTGRSFLNVPKSVLKSIDREPLCNTHKVKTIETFDYSQFGSVIESVKKYGGISFVSDKKKAGLSMLNSVQSIVREYKHSSLFQYNSYQERFLSGKDDDVLNIISFLDFANCVPLFNMRKIDGMCISFSQVIRKHSELLEKQVNTFRLDIVVSNYSDNLFTIDGTVIDHEHLITRAIYKDIKNYIKKDLPIKKDKLKQKNKKQTAGGFTDEFAVYIDLDASPGEPTVYHNNDVTYVNTTASTTY